MLFRSPVYLHYTEHGCIGDVVAVPDLGWVVYDKPINSGGMHGYDPTYTDMWAMFRAISPNIRHAQVKPFRNVSVYALLCNLLGITPAENDGCIDDVKSIIKAN